MAQPVITQHELITRTPEGLVLDTQLLAGPGGKVTPESVESKLAAVDWDSLQGETLLLKGCAPTWVFMVLTHRLTGVAAHLGFRQFDGQTQAIY